MIKAPKKLIEVALPLDAINAASAREKSIRHGHPSTLHLWWARRPLAAARAVLFAQLVNDPGGERGWGKYKGQTKEDAEKERQRLFSLIEQLVKWENTNNEDVLEQAREEIRKSWRETCELNKGQPGFDPDKLPPFHDPFAGGGSIPLEAQRLGLEAHASDLNPVAVLINKAMIEIPPKFAGRPPVGPLPPGEKQTKSKDTESWPGATGLAEDVRRYGAWMRAEAEKRIGHLYPKVKVTAEMAEERPDLKKYVGRELTVIAWLWARTVPSPNPAVGGAHVPLVSSFWLSKKKGKETWVEPVVDGSTYRFVVRKGKPKNPKALDDGTVSRKGARCLLTGATITFKYLREQAKAGEFRQRLLAVVAEGERERVYTDPTIDQESAAKVSPPRFQTGAISHWPGRTNVVEYGMTQWSHLFTDRQLLALTTFSDLVGEVMACAKEDAIAAGMPDDGIPLHQGGKAANGYADAVGTWLAVGVSRYANPTSTICTWNPGKSKEDIRYTFSRQALPMTWDFAEGNPFSDSSGNFSDCVEQWLYKAIRMLPTGTFGLAAQQNATALSVDIARVISSDPPYYDNISYADLSDYFYVWLRRSLGAVMPELFGTLLVPKAEELVATPYRHGGREEAERFFLDGMGRALAAIRDANHPGAPATIYYAFKQSDSDSEGDASTGWETFLAAVLQAGWAITATWPMRTERTARSISIGTNALASSIILALRPRPADAPSISRREFLRALRDELPLALDLMIGGAEGRAPIAPVDLAQAAIGPGMAIFSRYAQVLEANGEPMSVRQALIHINKAIDDYFTEAEGEMDADTRFCVDWFQQYGFATAKFGEADVLARAKGTSVEGLVKAGVLHAQKGDVRLLSVKEYGEHWDPREDERVPVWEACHQLCRALDHSEAHAGQLLARMPAQQEPARQLAYRLYTLCERKGWAEDARRYNALVTSWPAIVERSREAGIVGAQLELG